LLVSEHPQAAQATRRQLRRLKETLAVALMAYRRAALVAVALALRVLLRQLQPVRMVVLDQLTQFQERLSIMPVAVAGAQQAQQPEG
jgi:inorganic triphosphatase YgiF